MAYLAAVLERCGRSVRIIDAFAESLSREELLQKLAGSARVIGFYCHTANYVLVSWLAERLKALPNPPLVIIGGPHATALPEESLRDAPGIDAVVFGEAEDTIIELVDALLAGRSLAGIHGVVYRSDGGQCRNPPRTLVEDLDRLPMPAWHLLPMHRYHSFLETDGKRVVQLIGSRGCFSDCNYCFSTQMWGTSTRFHSVGRVLAEAEFLQNRYGIQFIQFLDDNFTLDAARAAALGRGLLERGLSWCCSTRIDLLTADVARELRRNGVHHVCIGIETVSDRLLKVINKHVTREQTSRTIEICRREGVRVMGMFILGIPTETRTEALETIDFAVRNDLYLAVFSFFTAYPGTNFWRQLRGSPHLASEFPRYCLSREFTYIEPGRTRSELEKLMRSAYLRFYLRPRVVGRLAAAVVSTPRLALQTSAGFASVLGNLLWGRLKTADSVKV